ncbi:MAG: transcriptional regulator [Gammaproteobacteria bacterium]|nr:MAG: transcriptional regulator [Gammaproteobacteria bacterium]
MSEQEADTLMEFPCDFAIKAMGPTSDDFDSIVVGIILQYVDSIKEGSVKTKQSSGGKFTSVSVDFHIESKQKLDEIYHALSEHQQVKYIL